MAKEIRFAIGSREDIQSSVWRLWANKDDLYLAARSTAGLSKISFHQSGICRFAVVSNEPRAPISKWQRPKELAPGVTPMFSIIVPGFVAEDRYRDQLPPANKKIQLLPPPEIASKLIVRVVVTNNTVTEQDLRKFGGGKLIFFHGSIQMRREKAWLISNYDDLKTSEVEFIKKHAWDVKITTNPPGASKDFISNIRIHMLEMIDNDPRIVDIQLGPDNLEIVTQ